MKSVYKKRLSTILWICSIVLSARVCNGQAKEVYTVAIFLYQQVELLDFAGPTEVFAATPGFKVYTVSVDGKEILSQGIVKVHPEYSIDQAPSPDIIIFPGGSAGPSSRDEKVLHWTRQHFAGGSVVMSVCTGAFILARAGLLDTLAITTHYGSLSALQDLLPSAMVLDHTRYVDNDRILTTAGVSAGIDGALHLVARIKGLEAAKSTAHYMEYDKWDPDAGEIKLTNPYLQPFSGNDNGGKGNAKITEKPIPFEGELIAFVENMHQKNAYHLSVPLLEKGIKWYPYSAGLYDQLGMAYAKEGKPAPMSSDSFMKLIEETRIEEAIGVFEKAKEKFPGWLIFSESEMNDAAYDLAHKGKFMDALKLFELNTIAYPTSANVWDSLGEGYMMAGNKKEAILHYQKSLEIDPGNENAIRMLEKLETGNE